MGRDRQRRLGEGQACGLEHRERRRKAVSVMEVEQIEMAGPTHRLHDRLLHFVRFKRAILIRRQTRDVVQRHSEG